MARELSELTYGELMDLRKKALLENKIMAFGEISEQLQIDPDSYDEFSEERNLWDKYVMEKMFFADQSLNISAPRIVLEVPKGGKKPKYRITYEDAERILDNFSRSELYLRGLVTRITGDSSFVSDLDYRALLHEGCKIRGVAQKILKTSKSK